MVQKSSGKVSGSKSKKTTKVLPNFDAKTITLKEAAQMYVDLTGNKSVKSAAVKLLKQYEDTALVDLFMQDDKGMSIISKTIPFADQEFDDIKSPMQALRYIGNMIKDPKGGLNSKDNIFEFLPDAEVNTDKNINIFKIKEPPKSTGSALSVNSDPKLHAMMFDAIDDIGKDNPNLRVVADAVLFNLQTGLRPNAVGGLQLDDKTYNPETKSIYISSEAKGAKGNFVNVPLNDLANSILQNQMANKQVKFFKGKKDFPAGNYFFVKPNGIPVDSTDMTKLLKMLPPIPKLFFNTDTQKFYNEFAHPEMSKKGSQLIRNIHTTIASRRLFIPYDRIAYLQGRSLKGVGMSDIGEVLTYDVQFPGDVDPTGKDAANANKFASFYANSAKKAGFDITEIIPPPENYILTDDPVIKEYNVAREKALVEENKKVNTATDTEIKTSDALDMLKELGINIEYDDTSKVDERVMLEDKLPPNIDVDSSGQAVMTDQSEINLPRIKSPKGLGGATMATLAGKDIDAEQAGGFLARSAAEEVAEFGVSKALKPLVGVGPAGIAALATTTAMQPSTGAGPEQLMFEQMTDDQRRKYLSMSASDQEAFIANQSGEQKEYVMPFIPQPQTDNELVE